MNGARWTNSSAHCTLLVFSHIAGAGTTRRTATFTIDHIILASSVGARSFSSKTDEPARLLHERQSI